MFLKFIYTLLEHPYKDEPYSRGENWAWIKLSIVDINQNEIKTILNTQWDINVFVKWFKENRHELITGMPPITPGGISIARDIYTYLEQID